MNGPNGTERRTRLIFSRLRLRRRSREERRQRQLKKAQQLAAMQSERGRIEGMY